MQVKTLARVCQIKKGDDMSMLQQLNTVYFDTLRLEDNLVRLSTRNTHSQTGNFAIGMHPESTFTAVRASLVPALYAGLKKDLESLRQNLLLLEKDLCREINRLLPEEIEEGLEPHLFLLRNEINALHALIDQIEICIPLLTDLSEHETPEFIQKNQVKLRHCLHQIEKIVGTLYGRS